ncbi:hypothetical protein B5V01_26525 [Mesorhizobium erdmanii]|uniref:Uncharacterized protein n=2 Tax=Mesorhizobium TaxID=68287 RepID=A0A3M9X383_9HYPH|nr:hypothetical protein DNR46_29610 [Mesorhizobium japonicum]RXT39115.1 hypothetical protein B5V01_26525 [Mesorhizobium erdmanii]
MGIAKLSTSGHRDRREVGFRELLLRKHEIWGSACFTTRVAGLRFTRTQLTTRSHAMQMTGEMDRE